MVHMNFILSLPQPSFFDEISYDTYLTPGPEQIQEACLNQRQAPHLNIWVKGGTTHIMGRKSELKQKKEKVDAGILDY